jgi:hypothetical protein
VKFEGYDGLGMWIRWERQGMGAEFWWENLLED